MKWMCMIAVGVLCLPGPIARAQEKPATAAIIEGKAWPPQFAEVQGVSLDKRVIERVTTNFLAVKETSEREEIRDGRIHKVPVTITRCVPEKRIDRHEFEKLRAVRPSGEEISQTELTKAIGKGAVVVLSTDPQGNISKDIVKLLTKDAVILLGVPGLGAAGPKPREPEFDPYKISPGGRINTPPSLAPPPQGE